MLVNHASFEVVGDVITAETKEKRSKPGEYYGQIRVACGTIGLEFFVETKDIESGRFARGTRVKATGPIEQKGRFDVQLGRADVVVVDEKGNEVRGGKQTTAA